MPRKRRLPREVLVKVLSVVGARPQFVKLAPVAAALRNSAVEHIIVHTGQHYDASMSDVFFADLRIPEPDVSLGVGSGSHGVQTAAMLARLEPVLLDQSPDWVLVYGDTNSTLAAAVCAVKIHLPVAHLEAGLRSGNRRMPEEHNRILTDHASDLLLAPTLGAVDQLTAEGLASRTVLVGDVMIDVCLSVARADVGHTDGGPSAGAIRWPVSRRNGPPGGEHRRSDAAPVASRGALAELPLPAVLPVHPRLRDRASAAGLDLHEGSLRPIEPLPYPEMVQLVSGSRAILTDSGGLQKEAYTLGIPCTTLRTETEWVETLTGGWNALAAEAAEIRDVVLRPRPLGDRPPHFGDGNASARVVEALLSPR